MARRAWLPHPTPPPLRQGCKARRSWASRAHVPATRMPRARARPQVWNLTNCKLKNNLVGHKGYVNTVTVSPDGSLCASGGKVRARGRAGGARARAGVAWVRAGGRAGEAWGAGGPRSTQGLRGFGRVHQFLQLFRPPPTLPDRPLLCARCCPGCCPLLPDCPLLPTAA